MYASVIIPTYNRRKILERTLQGLANQSVSSDGFEIVVVDDCSSDDTDSFMKRTCESFSNLTYIRHAENQGRVITRNDGVVAARGELIIFLDDDNFPGHDFVNSHIEYHAQNGDEHIVVMGNVRFADEVIAGSNFARYLQSRYLGFRSENEKAKLDYSNLPARCLGTLNCSMRREDLLAIGMLDTSFRYYGGEDEYLGYCLSRAGLRIIFGEQARSVHRDDLSIQRYKSKVVETTRAGYRVILGKGNEYFEQTQVRFLLPVDWRKDSLRRIAIKRWIKILLNPLTVFLLERWAILSDGYSWLYFQPVYRLLTAGWGLSGFRSSRQEIGLVTYGKTAT
ncbi:MAG TPA: glycosyltransferase family 2 protein [Pyrinomonadaceae bacterium]|nr:glycosyltransferase family 2 protein [Pyrinomonadaceae bacterium]